MTETRGRIYYACCRHCGSHGEHRNVRHGYPCEVPDCPGSCVRRADEAGPDDLRRGRMLAECHPGDPDRAADEE